MGARMTSYGISPAPNEQRYATAGPGAQAIHRPFTGQLQTVCRLRLTRHRSLPIRHRSTTTLFCRPHAARVMFAPPGRARSRLRCNIDDTLLPSFSHCALPLTG
jgi:hypothetical protein